MRSRLRERRHGIYASRNDPVYAGAEYDILTASSLQGPASVQLEGRTCVLDDVLITDELRTRATPARDLAAENAAFFALVRAMAVDASHLLGCLVEVALSLCSAGSAGVSLLERSVSGRRVFRWAALGGEYAGYVGGTTYGEISPCGVCLQRDAPQLYAAPARYFTELAAATPPIVEALVVPLRGEAGGLGTIWIVSHDLRSRFTMRDVTVMTGLADLTSATLTLQRARARAEELSRMKDEFLSMVSHELRVPLNTILGWSDLLLSGAVTPERAAFAVEAIHASATRQAVLVDDLLDTGRIVAGSLRVARHPVDLSLVARRALADIEPATAEKRVLLRSEFDEGLPAVSGDANRLQQIVGNLLDNAVKFTPASGMVELTVRRGPGAVLLSVADTGIGIPPDQLASVFEPFHQLDASSTRRHGGLGLGLTIVRRLAALHGGTIHAESAGLGTGATFVLRLPYLCSAAAHGSLAVEEPPSAVADGSLAGLRVLVVDDEADHRELVACALTHAGASIVCAESAEAALTALSDAPVDVLLSDLAMPDEDGWSLIARIRAGSAAPDLPAIALSAHATDPECERALAAGFDRHLTKPADLAMLKRTILEVARQRSAV